MIDALMSTVISLRDQGAAMKRSLDASLSKPLGSPRVPPDSICFTVVNKAKEVVEWTNEIDYPPDQKRYYLEEEAIENGFTEASREHALFDDTFTEEVKRTSDPLFNPP